LALAAPLADHRTEYLPQVIKRVLDLPIVTRALICCAFGETADNDSSVSWPGDPVSVVGRIARLTSVLCLRVVYGVVPEEGEHISGTVTQVRFWCRPLISSDWTWPHTFLLWYVSVTSCRICLIGAPRSISYFLLLFVIGYSAARLPCGMWMSRGVVSI